MLRWLGLWRLVLGRVRSDWPFLLALWLLIASATTLIAAGTLYAETVEVGGLRRALAEAPAQQRAVAVRYPATPADLAQTEPALRRLLDDAFGPAGAETHLTVRSSSLRPIGADGEGLTVLGAYEGLAEHAELRAGSWPSGGEQPLQAALSEGAAAALGVEPGDSLALADASTPGADPARAVVEVRIVGIFATSADDPYWLGDRLELDGAEQAGSRYRGPLMVAREDLLAAGFRQLEVRWRALPLIERLRIERLDAVRAAIGGLPRGVEQILPAGRFVSVERGISDVLGRIDRSSLVSRSGVVLITLQFAVLAGYAVLLVGGILAERRRPEVALLRARGASTAEIGLIATGEALVLIAPAVAAAPLLAIGLVNTVGGWGAVAESGIIGSAQLSSATILSAGLAGFACIAALTLPALLAEVDLARVRAAIGRPMSQTLAQRLGLDLVLLLLAVVGIVQLRTYGSALTSTAGGNLELDPLLVAAPAIALGAGAVLVVRLVPRLGELAEYLLRRRRGMLLALGTRGVARRPLRYTRAALLIVLATALGTFGSMYAATWSRSQHDQAAQQVGADARVVLPAQPVVGPAEARARLAALPGVLAVSPVAREPFDVGRVVRRAEMLAVEPETLSAVLGTDHGELLAQLAAERSDDGGIALPAAARRLAVVLDAQLEPIGADAIEHFEPAEWNGISVVPLVQAGDAAQALEARAAMFAGGGQRLVFDLPAASTGEAARLVGVELTVSTPTAVVGPLELTSFETSLAAEGDDWQLAARPADFEGWSMTTIEGSVPALGDDSRPSLTWDREHALRPNFERQPVYRWAPADASAPDLAAFANGALLAAAGVDVGDRLSIDYGFQPVGLRVIGRLDAFPSTDPRQPAVLVDGDSLDRVRFALRLAPATPDEWWLDVDDDQVAAVADALRREPVNAESTTTRLDLTQTLLRDPIALGLVGALLLGSIAAVAFATVGLLVGAVVSAREQLGELALLRALGASGRQVVGWLALEHGFVLTVGLLAGAGVGYLLGVLVLPQAPLNRSGTPVVPPPTIVVPFDLLALVGAAGIAVVVLAVLIARREVLRRPVVDVLRERED